MGVLTDKNHEFLFHPKLRKAFARMDDGGSFHPLSKANISALEKRYYSVVMDEKERLKYLDDVIYRDDLTSDAADESLESDAANDDDDADVATSSDDDDDEAPLESDAADESLESDAADDDVADVATSSDDDDEAPLESDAADESLESDAADDDADVAASSDDEAPQPVKNEDDIQKAFTKCLAML